MVSDYRLTEGRVKTILMVGTILMVEFGTSSASGDGLELGFWVTVLE